MDRQGHTEGSIELIRLAGLIEVGIIIAKEVPTAKCIIYCGSIPTELKI